MGHWDPKFRRLKNDYQFYFVIQKLSNLLILWIPFHCKIERVSVEYINQDMYCAQEINNGKELKLYFVLQKYILTNQELTLI